MVDPKVRISSVSEADSNGFVCVEPLQLTIPFEKSLRSRRMQIRNQSEMVIVCRIFDWMFYFWFARIWKTNYMFYWGWMLFEILRKFCVYKAAGYNGSQTPLELGILQRGAPEKLSGVSKNRKFVGEFLNWFTITNFLHKSSWISHGLNSQKFPWSWLWISLSDITVIWSHMNFMSCQGFCIL